MANRTLTPLLLAKELETDVDDVLLMLWDGGVDYPASANSRIREADVARAREACGAVIAKEKLLVSYWTERLEMTPEHFRAWASEQKVNVGPNARRLPKGGLARIERAVRGTSALRPSPSRSRSEAPPKKRKHLDWRVIGHQRDQLRHLSADEIEGIHFEIAEDFRNTPDPIAPAGVRDHSLLHSAAGRPLSGVGDYLKYPTVEMAAAALVHSIIHNHAFFNGNKRTALVSMLAFLDENALVLESSQEEIFRWTIRIASHKLGAAEYSGDISDVEVYLMAQWLVQQCRNVEAGERVVTFSELRRRLQVFDCTVQMVSARGGRVLIERAIEQRTFFGLGTRIQRHRFRMPYGGEGREVSRSRLKELRRELQLSDEFGIDSASFYGNEKKPVDAFIAQYRKTLRRLARL